MHKKRLLQSNLDYQILNINIFQKRMPEINCVSYTDCPDITDACARVKFLNFNKGADQTEGEKMTQEYALEELGVALHSGTVIGECFSTLAGCWYGCGEVSERFEQSKTVIDCSCDFAGLHRANKIANLQAELN